MRSNQIVRTGPAYAILGRGWRLLVTAVSAGLLATAPLRASEETAPAPDVEWAWRGGDAGASQYSRLGDIHAGNVARLGLAWNWATGEQPLSAHGASPGMFETTPLMIEGVLYLTTPYNRVVALDAATGRERWSYDPQAWLDGQPPNGTGFVHRGLAAWRDRRTGQLKLLLASRYRLIQLDARSGRPERRFGREGIVNLLEGLPWPVNPRHYTNTSPPVVYEDLVIVGNGVADKLIYRHDPPGDVRAYDLRSGRRVWSFHTVPRPSEAGSESWGRGSNRYTGHVNVWPPMSVDLARGLIYLPVSTPSNDFYGGNRPGENLYADSLVCLDAATGRRRWHRQLVHHGLWDYDPPAAPVLARITRQGREREAVIQLTKQGFVFAFDRVSGEPLWPIEERPVPASDVPGEAANPTQPAPVGLPALVPQGASLEDANDLTPALHAQAIEALRRMRLGPLFTPPSVQGTLMRPGVLGGVDWGGGAFDPDTGVLYAKVNDDPALVFPDLTDANGSAPEIGPNDAGEASLFLEHRIPLLKPPYAFVDAIDLSSSTLRWQVPFGDNPALRAHPALRGAQLPPALGAVGSAGAIVTAGGLVFVGGGDAAFHALDKHSGAELWRFDTDELRVNATPMTYRSGGRQYVVVAAGGPGPGARLLAFALDGTGKLPPTGPQSASAAATTEPATSQHPIDARASFERACSQCHALETVLRTPRTAGQWRAQVDAMLAKGAKLSDAEAEAVIDYLAANHAAH